MTNRTIAVGFRLLSRRFTPQPRCWRLTVKIPVSASCHGDSHLSQKDRRSLFSWTTDRFPPPVTEIHTSALMLWSVAVSATRNTVSASCHGDSHLSPPTADRRPGLTEVVFPPPVTEIHTSAQCVLAEVTTDDNGGFRLLSRRFTPQPPGAHDT